MTAMASGGSVGGGREVEATGEEGGRAAREGEGETGVGGREAGEGEGETVEGGRPRTSAPTNDTELFPCNASIAGT